MEESSQEHGLGDLVNLVQVPELCLICVQRAGNAKSILGTGLSLHIAAVAFHAIAGVLGQPFMALGMAAWPFLRESVSFAR